MSLAKIEKACEKYNAACLALTELVNQVNAEIESVHTQHRSSLEKLAKKCAQAQASLRDLIKNHPDLFEKPKTQTFAGIKVGYQKGKDTLEMDEDRTIDLILKKFPDQKDVLIKTTMKPVAAAIMNLDARQQKAVGVSVALGVDEVVVKPTDTAVNKAVAAQLAQVG